MMRTDLTRFIIVGIGSNIINFMVYRVAYYLEFSLFLASTFGYVAGLIFSYQLGRTWVFGKSFAISKKNLFYFLIVYAIGGLIMSLIIEIFTKKIFIDYKISWLFGATYAAVNNFLGQRFLVFKSDKNL